MPQDRTDPALKAWYRRRTIDIADEKAGQDESKWRGLGAAARSEDEIDWRTGCPQYFAATRPKGAQFMAMAVAPADQGGIRAPNVRPARGVSEDNSVAGSNSTLVDRLEDDFGGLAELEESSRKGPATIGRQSDDPGGASYGAYQFASNTGALDEFLTQSGYSDRFVGLSPGAPEFDEAWVKLANADPEFGSAQKRYVLKTYYERPMERLRRQGSDLTERGRAVREAEFATSIQYGQNSGLLGDALRDIDLENATDRQIVEAIQKYKLDHVDEYFGGDQIDRQKSRIQRDNTRLEGLMGVEDLMRLGIPYFR